MHARGARSFALLLALAGASACGRRPLASASPRDGAAGTTATVDSGSPVIDAREPGVDGAEDTLGHGDVPDGFPFLDPGRPALRHLTNLEYDLTTRDLLGVTGSARQTFISSERCGDFDVIGDCQTFNDARVEQYADNALYLAAATFADATLRARIVTCQPAVPGDEACTRAIVTAFGLRAWRRPLVPAEVDGLVALARAALTEGASFDDAIERVVAALLTSAPFLMRVELDPDPNVVAVHGLDPYELASRLSYLMWSSMPDDRLFAWAADGTLATDSGLTSEVDRLLADPRSDGFVEAFAAHWLGLDELATLQREPALLPDFDEPLRDAMGQEARLYFEAFLRDDLDFRTFTGADFNFVNARLARNYDMVPPSSGEALTRVDDLADGRAGFLGLGAFLTQTASSGRSSPTARGEWILDHLLCSPVPDPPQDTPDVIANMRPGPPRALVDSIDGQASCATCHKAMDGLGMALEAFDQLGRFRTTYADGTPVDTKGALGDVTFDGEAPLAAAVAHDPRFLACVSRKVLTFAVNRVLADTDKPYVDQVLTRWTSGTPTLRALLASVVLNDTFRFRHAEAAP